MIFHRKFIYDAKTKGYDVIVVNVFLPFFMVFLPPNAQPVPTILRLLRQNNSRSRHLFVSSASYIFLVYVPINFLLGLGLVMGKRQLSQFFDTWMKALATLFHQNFLYFFKFYFIWSKLTDIFQCLWLSYLFPAVFNYNPFNDQFL